MDLLAGIFGAFGLSASAGLNAYIPLLVVALIARYTDLIKLAAPWDALSNGWIISLILVLAVIELIADKLPAVNHANDAVQSFVRPAAGAILFAASAHVITEIHPVLSMAAGILVSGSVHFVKSVAVRPAITATTAGAGNVPVSILEDLISTVVSIFSILIPILLAFITLVMLFIAFWFLRRRSKRAHSLA